MANDGEISAAVVREYFLKNGGKVKRDDLFDHFRGQLDKFGDQGGSKNRFGDIVNSLASLQNIEGEKYFVLKKSRNGTTPVMLRRPVRQANQRKEKGVSLPATMKSFRFSAAEDAFGNLTIPDKARPVALTRVRTGYRSESSGNDFRASRNNSDTTENGLAQDSGLDTSVSSLPSDSPRGSRQSSFSRTSEYDQMSQNSGDTGFFNEEDPFELEIPSYVLTPFEKSWMMSAIAGNKSAIICQLEENPKIVSFKDFIMGYSALHWAAKQGNEELVRLLIDAGAEVNMKSNGGYTPLHLAALHGKVNIIHILVDIYHADLRIRDHSGKEAKDLVSKNSSEEIKQKLQDPRAVDVTDDLANKFPSSVVTGKTKHHRMKLGKILGRKHHALLHQSQVDGECDGEVHRSPTESSGPMEYDEVMLDSQEPDSVTCEELMIEEDICVFDVTPAPFSGEEGNLKDYVEFPELYANKLDDRSSGGDNCGSSE